jgi:hypothetical protein
VLAGCLLLAVATVPFMFVTGHTPYPLLAGVLFARGLGLGAAVQPSVAAAYQLIDSAQVPRATAALNNLRQTGGAFGATLLAVVLQHEGAAAVSSLRSAAGGLLTPLPAAERVRISGTVATAFDHTFVWALLMALLTLVPATALIHAERTHRHQRTPARVEPGESEPTVPQARAA